MADVVVQTITVTVKSRRRGLVASRINYLVKNVEGDAIDAVQQQVADSVDDQSGSGMTATLANNLHVSPSSVFVAVTQGLVRVTTTTSTTAPRTTVVTITLAGRKQVFYRNGTPFSS